jgi:hypothetical protein
MAPWITGYGMFLVGLFTICTAILGFTTTMWSFVTLFVGCTVAALALWWQEEQWWQTSLHARKSETINAPPNPLQVMTDPLSNAQLAQQDQDGLTLEDADFDLLETYTQELTERVQAVYPLVGRDHVHKIVWTVMVELFCKRIATASPATPASIIAAKIARAA